MTSRRVLGGLGAAIALVLVMAVLVGSCRDPEANTLPPPSSTSSTAPTTTTSAPDYSLIALPAIEGNTTTTAPIGKGRATLRGIVEGPEGPVPNAVIRAERLVGDAVQQLDVRAGADGTFVFDGVPGGRYRVRAFLPPSLAMGDPQIFYQADGEVRDMRLRVEEFSGIVVRDAVTPTAPVVGDGVNLAVRVSERRVGDDGIAREVPLADLQVRVDASGWTPLDAEPIVATRSDGIAVFQFRCDRVTAVSATAVIGGSDEVFPLDVPPCSPRATTTSTTSSTSTSTPDDDQDGEDDEDEDGGGQETTTSTTAA